MSLKRLKYEFIKIVSTDTRKISNTSTVYTRTMYNAHV